MFGGGVFVCGSRVGARDDIVGARDDIVTFARDDRVVFARDDIVTFARGGGLFCGSRVGARDDIGLARDDRVVFARDDIVFAWDDGVVFRYARRCPPPEDSAITIVGTMAVTISKAIRIIAIALPRTTLPFCFMILPPR
ncbi:MAG: hypothetical protein LBN12_05560 [Clostridiales Family XIII bacterium]|nr:hypothetical protein [Clostridiales Family XIII bacterium]